MKKNLVFKMLKVLLKGFKFYLDPGSKKCSCKMG